MTNMLSSGVKLLPNLVVRIQEKLKKTFGKLSLTNFPVNMVYFLTGVHVGIIPNEQISRYLHQRLSELFLLECAGHTEHPDWQHS